MIEQYVNTEELRRLVSSLVVVVGAILIFVLFAFIVVPGLRNANRPLTAPSGSLLIGQTGWLDPAEFPPQKSYKVPPIDPETVLVPTPELLEKGQELYVKICAQCHGDTGRGDGPASRGLTPPPRDFTGAAGWKNGFQLPGIFQTLTDGIEGSAMASFSYLSKADRMALAHHVQSFITFSREPVDEEALKALSDEIGRAGETVPNKIPVSMAMARLEEEFEAPPALSLPADADRSPPAELLRRAVRDPARAALTLAGAPGWREDSDLLAQAAVSGAPGNGFSVFVTTLGPEEWQALKAALTMHGEPR